MKSTCECPKRRRRRRQVGADVGLAPAGEADPEDLSVRRVGSRAGRGEPLELVVVFDGAKHRECRRHGHVRCVGQPALQPQQVHRPSRVGQCVAPRPEKSRCRLVRVAAVGPVREPEDGGAGCLLRVGPFEPRDDHRRLAVDGDDQHGDAFGDRDGRVSREVEQVRSGGEQQPGQAGRFCGPRRSLQSRGEVCGGERGGCGLRRLDQSSEPPRRRPLPIRNGAGHLKSTLRLSGGPMSSGPIALHESSWRHRRSPQHPRHRPRPQLLAQPTTRSRPMAGPFLHGTAIEGPDAAGIGVEIGSGWGTPSRHVR